VVRCSASSRNQGEQFPFLRQAAPAGACFARVLARAGKWILDLYWYVHPHPDSAQVIGPRLPVQ